MAYVGANQDTAYGRYIRSHGPRGFDWRYLAPVAGIAAAPALGALLGGGGAAASGSATVNGLPLVPHAASVASGTAGGGMTLGSLLGSRGFEVGANALTSLFGMRSQNRANRYATDANARLTSEQLAFERERIRRQEEADALDRADAERRWQAEQERYAREHAASEEERAYRRTISDRQLRLDDEREARRAVFRPYSERAMRSLGAILGIR
jgi:hypothetical protein